MGLAVPRKYDAPRRIEQAEATRLAIIDAAAQLFEERGYGATTMAAIASQARVSAKSVYTHGDKAHLLVLALDRKLLGDADAGLVGDRPSGDVDLGGGDAVEAARRGAASAAPALFRMYRLYRAFEQAAAVDEDIAPVWQDYEKRRREDFRRVVLTFQKHAPLPEGLDTQLAADTLWSLVGWHPVSLLVEQRSWGEAQVTRWVEDVFVAVLVGPQFRKTSRSRRSS